MRFAIFLVHLSKLLRLARKKWCQVIRSAAPVTQNHLSKPEDLRPPGPPNSSDEHVSCIVPATENASLQIFADPLQMSHACHRFWKCYKTLAFCFLLTRSTIPYACHAKRHLNVQKWSEPMVFLSFWLRNVLRAATACTFSTSHLPKVVRTCTQIGKVYNFTFHALTMCTSMIEVDHVKFCKNTATLQTSIQHL